MNPNLQAFPGIIHDSVTPSAAGLTKRELFAAMAMQGWLAWEGSPSSMPGESVEATIARCAVESADALIAELSKVKP